MSPAPQQQYHPSIIIPGLYSLQCIARASGTPDITYHREDLGSLVGSGDSVMRRMAAHKRFSHFALRHATDKADFYDKFGKEVTVEASKPVPVMRGMSVDPQFCDHGAMLAHARWLTPSPTVCGSFEAHSGQSAAGRGNFYSMLDQLLNQARSDLDREHICVLSYHVPCPTSLLVGDLSKATERAQGVFLDYFKRVRSGWPLSEPHHRTELSRTLAGCRFAELSEWLLQVRMTARPSEDEDRFRFLMGAVPAKVRLAIAAAVVEELYEKFLLPADGKGVERLPSATHAVRFSPRLDQLLAEPMSKI